MNGEKKMVFENYLHIFLLFVVIGIVLSGCRTQQPVIVDTGDIERLRYEYQQLRDEYDRLKQDYARLIADQQFYVDYYLNATTRIGQGIRELQEIGNSSAAEIAKLRSCIAIIRNIVNGIIEGQQGERQQDTQIDGDG
ncbi:MAG: hypothetical protein LBU85_08860 [Treponema sp.]|jgi:hypothetical protein|nr:hypothetical protein [Treponema sp.]